jgi:gamma-glutamyltranspeptidase/glutathione hydrolase
MARWRAAIEEPKHHEYRGWRVHKTGPWGQGPAFLQQLALLDGYELNRLDPVGPDFIHLVTEAAKLALADRDAWYGDPAFSPDLVGELLDPAYNRERRALIGERASLELRPGSPGGREPRMPGIGPGAGGGAGEPGLGEPTLRETRGRGDTCHLDVVDRWGNMVSATPSGGWLQSSPVVPGLGFCMGSRLQMAQLEEGLPSSLAPGKRPRTTLTPSLALRGRGDGIAFGTPGGDQQDQWTLTFFVRLAATGWNLQRLIDTPMFHTASMRNSFYPHEFEPGRLAVEERVGAATIEELRRRGHDVVVQDAWSLGRISAAGRDGASGMLRAAANPRGMLGYAAGR